MQTISWFTTDGTKKKILYIVSDILISILCLGFFLSVFNAWIDLFIFIIDLAPTSLWGPIENVSDYYSFLELNIFEGLVVPENSQNLANASIVANIYAWFWFCEWPWQNCLLAPPKVKPPIGSDILLKFVWLLFLFWN